MQEILTIARKADLTNYDLLRNHPKVLRVVDLPYDYVIFEFWDDVFPKLYDHEKKYHQNLELLKKAGELREETDALVKPLYERSTPTNFVSGVGLTINKNDYVMFILRKERFIETMFGMVDPIDQDCIFEANFKELTDKKKAAFEKVIADWQQWALGSTLLNSCEAPVYADKKAVLKIHFPEEFEDALAALIIMLNHTRLKTGVVKLVY